MVNSGRQCRSFSSRLFSVLSALNTGATGDVKIGEKEKARKNWKQETGGRDKTAIEIKEEAQFSYSGMCSIQRLGFGNPRIRCRRKRE